ncbi:MAG: nicotinamide riboside transporter PnuC [Bacteroidota bacterium]|nr:nicotinamide riboside transporter PnuC [Bacteroidota bacterium]
MDNLLTFLEIFGAITGLAGVWLTTLQHVRCWPLLIFSSIAYGIVFLHDSNALYADGTLQLIYIGMLVYGWKNWTAKNKTHLNPKYSSAKELSIIIIIYIILFFVLAQFLKDYTKDPLPYMDSFTFVGSIAAQYLQARKRMENWVIWFAVNTVYIYMYYDRGLYYTMILFAIFWVMSIIGWRTWRKEVSMS